MGTSPSSLSSSKDDAVDNKRFELVALVGSEGSGKSSLVESLVGKDFLPKGDDMCTRRPLFLQLCKRSFLYESEEEWGEFEHLPGKRFYDFSHISQQILIETRKEAGYQNCISDKPIHLKIFSPNVFNITIVDLPGMKKVPVGHQPSDIDIQVKSMIFSYIKRSTCLILACTPGNSDLTNSDALKISKLADPHGDRTIGVITKLDMVDEGANASNMLLGKVVPLHLGYIGVVNRSQEDYMFNCNIDYALAAEESFFCNHPVYSRLGNLCGIPRLAKKLNEILVEHTESKLPDLCISCALYDAANEYTSYSEIARSKVDQGAVLVNFFSNYTATFSSMFLGENEELASEPPGGAHFRHIFESIFVKSIEEIDPFEDLTVDNIKTMIQNATVTKSSSLLVPEVPFRVLVRRQIARLLDPSLQCAEFICDELIKISHRCLSNELLRFPVLRMCMHEVVKNFLRGALEQLETTIQNLVEMEMSCINSSHPDFIGGRKALEIAMQRIKRTSICLSNCGEEGLLPAACIHKVAVHGNSYNKKILVRIQAHSNSFLSIRPAMNLKTITCSGNNGSIWGISSIFGGSDSIHMAFKDSSTIEALPCMEEPVQQSLAETPLTKETSFRVSERYSLEEALEIAVTKLLVRSYFDIVRKNIKHYVPRAIVHALISPIKRELCNIFIEKLYREDLLENLLKESNEFQMTRWHTLETFQVLQRALLV